MLACSFVLCATGSILNPGVSAADTDKTADISVSRSWDLPAFHSSFDERMSCPDDHPYLVNEWMAPGRILPRGVTVSEPGSVGVSGSAAGTTLHAMGVQSLSLSNWNPASSATAVVSLHCTNDETRAARGM